VFAPLSSAYNFRCWRVESSGQSASCCGQNPSDRQTFCASVDALNPLTWTSPLLGASAAVIMRKVVVLPAPFGPSRPRHSFGRTPASAKQQHARSDWLTFSIIIVVPSLSWQMVGDLMG
jgi:hypothetical protein